MKRLFICICFVLGAISMQAQDIHFSQFYLSPLNLNPAMTGVMNCNVRLVANYRNQWASVLKSNAYNTSSVSYDQRVPIGRNDYFGIGGTFLGDRAGESNFSNTTGKLSASYSKRMGGYRQKAHYLVVGAEGGFVQKSIDFNSLRWPNQHDGDGGFDPTASSGEFLAFDNFIYADLSAGLMWFTVIDKNNSFYIGAAAHHLNRANQSFTGSDDNLLYSRYTLHAGGDFLLGQKFGLVPGIIVMKQGPSLQINPGTSLKFLLSSTKGEYQAFQVGAWVRVANSYDSSMLVDAAILATRFDYNNFSLGFSYDINVSPLVSASNGNGGFELALVYKICGQERRNVYCPRF